VVDVLDILAIFAAWGPCPARGTGEPPQDVGDCILRYGDDPEKMIGCIEAILRSEG
jgi:hypothetical protein